MAYATDKQVELAASLGYTHDRSAERGSSFTNGHRNIWATREGWQTADLLKGHYRNHKKFRMLDDAIQREIE
jgi:hypothetical protein